MDSVTRQRLKIEIDRKRRAKIKRINRSKKGELDIRIMQGDGYSADWPPRIADYGDVVKSNIHRRRTRARYMR